MLTMSKDTYGATGVNYTLLDGSDFRPVTPGIIPKKHLPNRREAKWRVFFAFGVCVGQGLVS